MTQAVAVEHGGLLHARLLIQREAGAQTDLHRRHRWPDEVGPRVVDVLDGAGAGRLGEGVPGTEGAAQEKRETQTFVDGRPSTSGNRSVFSRGELQPYRHVTWSRWGRAYPWTRGVARSTRMKP